jgi:hypothetical protein
MSEPKRQARVTTKTGDAGDTSLFGPGRIRKTDPRIEALGDLDETQSAIGLARAIATGSVAETLLELEGIGDLRTEPDRAAGELSDRAREGVEVRLAPALHAPAP